MRRLRALIATLLLNGSLAACASASGDVSAIPAGDGIAHRFVRTAQEVETGQEAKAPSGYLAFCERNPGECGVHRGRPSTLTYSQGLWEQLETVNTVVNETVRPLDDQDHYGVAEFWTVPVDGQGDCEDYVLAKRKMLTLLGLPAEALRITVVLNRNNVRHAVLTAVTTRGDYVLDSAQRDILPADQTGYHWIERQDAASPTGWIALN
jgi:predicted transglutaminase-like cysteine proteinase